jgi:hypothetical protein
VQIRRIASVFAVLGMTAAAFVTGGSASAASNPAPVPSKTLTARLLVSRNLPSGWKVVSSTGATGGLPPCLASLYKTVPGQFGVARRTFLLSDDMAAFQDRLVSFSRRQAETQTAHLEQTLATCKEKFGGYSFVIRRLKFSSVGAQSRAYLVTVEAGSLHPESLVIALARRADTVVVTTYAFVSGDKALQGKRFAQKAITKAG